MEYELNQYAPDYKQGLMQPPPDAVGFTDKTFEYVYNPPNGVLTANQRLTDAVQIDNDADFYIAGWYLSRDTDLFQIQLTDASGYQLSDGFIQSPAISLAAGNPTVLSPAHPIPAGGKIQIEIEDLSGAENAVQIVFKGWKRFRQPVSEAV